MKKLLEDKGYFFFLDIDGTIVKNNGKVNAATKRFLKKHNNWAISTGRDLEHIPKSIKISKYIISSNGSQIFNDKELISSVYFSEDEIELILDEWDGDVVDFHDGNKISSIKSGVCKISLFPKCSNKKLFEKFSFNEYDDHIELMPAGVSKGSAERKIIDFLKREGFNSFFHIGDSENDISAKSQQVKLISMSNGTKAIKEYADFVSSFSNEDGVQKTIQEIMGVKHDF